MFGDPPQIIHLIVLAAAAGGAWFAVDKKYPAIRDFFRRIIGLKPDAPFFYALNHLQREASILAAVLAADFVMYFFTWGAIYRTIWFLVQGALGLYLLYKTFGAIEVEKEEKKRRDEERNRAEVPEYTAADFENSTRAMMTEGIRSLKGEKPAAPAAGEDAASKAKKKPVAIRGAVPKNPGDEEK